MYYAELRHHNWSYKHGPKRIGLYLTLDLFFSQFLWFRSHHCSFLPPPFHKVSADKWDTGKICQDGEMLKLLGKSSGKNRSQKSWRESSQKSADLCNVQGFLKFLSDFCFEFTPRSHRESREDSSLIPA